MRRLFWLLWLLAAALALPAAAQPPPEPPIAMAFVGLHGGVYDLVEQAAPPLGVTPRYLTDAAIADGTADLAGVRFIYLQHLRAEDTARYEALFGAAHAAGARIFYLPGNGIEDLGALAKSGAVTRDARISAYYDNATAENIRRLLRYTLARYADRGPEPPPAETLPTEGLWHPDAPQVFTDAAPYRAWAATTDRADDTRPLVLVAVHALHLAVQQPRVVEALIRAIEARGGRALAILDRGPLYPQLLRALAPDALIHTCHSSDPLDLRRELDVPHLHAIFFRKQSIEDWRRDPQGLAPNEIAFHITGQELVGAIEPLIASGTLTGGGSAEAFVPIPDRVDHVAARALAWARLRRKPNADKKIAIVYYDRELGQSELMRGSATGQMLNAPKSLLAVLERLATEGYTVTDRPTTEDALLAPMRDHGRRIGGWIPTELDRVARSGHAVLVTVEQYRQWYEARVPPEQRAAVEARWGPPPGDIMVWRGAGAPQIVIPTVTLGNITLLPQPLRGEAHDPKLLHDTQVPPPHAYLATYFWLQDHADALIHFGTHGSEFALPGRGTGLAATDWPDVVLGALPNINPWIINNLGESMPARRRANAVLIGHLVPPSVTGGLSDDLEALHNEIDRWRAVGPGALAERFRAAIGDRIRATRLDADLALDLPPDRAPDDAAIDRVADHLHALAEEPINVDLHILGRPPRQAQLIPYLALCLGDRFATAIAPHFPRLPRGEHGRAARRQTVEAIITAVLRDQLPPRDALLAAGARLRGPLGPDIEDGFTRLRTLIDGFARTGDELDHLIAALAGRFVPPGPGNTPARNPAVVPTGRNFYVVNPEEIPARPAYAIGHALVDELLATEQKTRGRLPERVAFDLNPFASLQDYGVTEAQILALIGARPKWDAHELVADIEIIPRAELGRPRVDVFIAIGGYYRDMLPTRLALIDRAIRQIAALDEPDNPLARHDRAVRATLIAAGTPEPDATRLAAARVFGDPPGEYGDPTYYYLLERSGDWQDRAELMRRYVARQSHAYTDGAWGTPAQAAYEAQIAGTEIVLRAWSDQTRSPLNNKYMWLRGGSLAAAVEHITGHAPRYLLTDIRDPDRARLVTAEAAVRADLRVRLFNRKWLEGMMKEGYAGADQMAVHVANTLGWRIMRPDAVDDATWDQIVDVYLRDTLALGLRDHFAAHNPHAFQEIAEVLLEAARKGYWEADPQTLAEVARAYADSVAAYGPSGGLRSGPNAPLAAHVEALLAPEPDRVAAYRAARAAARPAREATAAAPQPPEPAPQAAAEPTAQNTPQPSPEITGERLEPAPSPHRWTWIALAAALTLLIAGFIRRSGQSR
ncbi:MAG: cobaltochelatase subunit CobN [Myxococcales bacterium]|nr:cobaltochelatase subunit CobN [Myxococcales bacterium]